MHLCSSRVCWAPPAGVAGCGVTVFFKIRISRDTDVGLPITKTTRPIVVQTVLVMSLSLSSHLPMHLDTKRIHASNVHASVLVARIHAFGCQPRVRLQRSRTDPPSAGSGEMLQVELTTHLNPPLALPDADADPSSSNPAAAAAAAAAAADGGASVCVCGLWCVFFLLQRARTYRWMNECARDAVHRVGLFSVLSIDVYLLQAPLAGVLIDGSMVDTSATTFACVNMSGTSTFLMFCASIYLITQLSDSFL
jgi:hypothetical protein